jgi:hypothetical protein
MRKILKYSLTNPLILLSLRTAKYCTIYKKKYEITLKTSWPFILIFILFFKGIYII